MSFGTVKSSAYYAKLRKCPFSTLVLFKEMRVSIWTGTNPVSQFLLHALRVVVRMTPMNEKARKTDTSAHSLIMLTLDSIFEMTSRRTCFLENDVCLSISFE